MQDKERQDAQSEGVLRTDPRAGFPSKLSKPAGQPGVTYWSPSAQSKGQTSASQAEESLVDSIPGTEYWLP